ncbi:unnamed protein product, partial [Discosporangium mesarthrocarpum]
MGSLWALGRHNPWRKSLTHQTNHKIAALRSLVSAAALNPHACAQTAANDCLGRVLGPSSTIACDLAFIFHEGHDPKRIQEAVKGFAKRYPKAPPVIGCTLGGSEDVSRRWRKAQLRRAQRGGEGWGDSTESQTNSKPRHFSFNSHLKASLANHQLNGSKYPFPQRPCISSQCIVTVLGLGFGGKAEVLPVSGTNDSFPDVGPPGTLKRLLLLPEDQQPHALLLCSQAFWVELDPFLEKIQRVFPGGNRLVGVAGGLPPTHVVSSFSEADVPVIGVLLLGKVTPQDLGEIARKTLGAFALKDTRVEGSACSELFLPSEPPPPTLPLLGVQGPDGHRGLMVPPTFPAGAEVIATAAGLRPPEHDRRSRGATVTGTGAPYASNSASPTSNRSSGESPLPARVRPAKASPSVTPAPALDPASGAPPHLAAFMVDLCVFPGATCRLRVSTPRHRALVKRCLDRGEAFVVLPAVKRGNAVGTVVFVSALEDVQANGNCMVVVTGLARCHVTDLWMRGESFGLHEVQVDFFDDDQSHVPRESHGRQLQKQHGGKAE